MASIAPIPSDGATAAPPRAGAARRHPDERRIRTRQLVRSADPPISILAQLRQATARTGRWLAHQFRVAMATTTGRGEALQAHPAALRALIRQSRVAMVTTRDRTGALHSEPMEATSREFDGEIWFALRPTASVLARVRSRPAVQVTYVDHQSNRCMVLDGIARVHADARRDTAQTFLRIDIVSADLWE